MKKYIASISIPEHKIIMNEVHAGQTMTGGRTDQAKTELAMKLVEIYKFWKVSIS